MFRLFALMLAVYASSAALAQTAFDPKIAYTSYEGNADNLYVANSDGSNRFIVYKVGKVRLGAIDMAPVDAADPGLRKIAFTQSGVLKMVRFRVFAAGPSVLDVTSLDAVGAPYQGAILPDFSPDGSKLVYIKKTPTINGTEPTDIYIVSASGTGSKLVWSATLSGGTYISSVRWTGAYEC